MRRFPTIAAAAAVCTAALLVAPASPTPPAAGAASSDVPNPAAPENPDNPLAGRAWGVYKGSAEPTWPAYVQATGDTKEQLKRLALTPKAKFFGAWIPDREITRKVADYIASATRDDPDALVQMTLFRMQPWEAEACTRVPTRAESLSYKRFVRRFAAAIGDTHAAVVVQPDGPIARCAPVYSRLVEYAVRTLEAQPSTTTYIEMGSADWFGGDPTDAVATLLADGVAESRGFALDTSHFDGTGAQVRFGAAIVDGLAAAGVPDAHFVIDTSDNGKPFPGTWWREHGDGHPLGWAPQCTTTEEDHCVTLGIPPTTDVASPAWPLTPETRALAAQHVDGYLWIGRPWLFPQGGSWVQQRALDLVATSPYDPLRQGAATP
ncbi:MAG TPA: glycoside hydrolase family 6 protein [Nocardioides sp.]|nr:glycoside hydrolase family 6 protein [Nocardioides sp.]